jgi:hypothetical protein
VPILRRDTGQVMLVSRARSPVRLPINAEGYLESIRSSGSEWLVKLNYFTGGSKVLGRVDSTCSPMFSFLSQKQVLAATCDRAGARRFTAMGTDGRRLWELAQGEQAIWPLLTMAPNGSRMARETLAVDHPVSSFDPLGSEDIKAQVVEVLNAADGKVALKLTATPILDAGGNVAISPSGRRVAALTAGNLQVFDLPEPPVLAESSR